MFCLAVMQLKAADYDFAVSEIIIKPDKFLYVKLENLSGKPLLLTADLKEKTALIIYINDVKRVEYKFKYFNPAFFSQKNSILHRTNFRLSDKEIKVKATFDPLLQIAEKNRQNNTLIQSFKGTSP